MTGDVVGSGRGLAAHLAGWRTPMPTSVPRARRIARAVAGVALSCGLGFGVGLLLVGQNPRVAVLVMLFSLAPCVPFAFNLVTAHKSSGLGRTVSAGWVLTCGAAVFVLLIWAVVWYSFTGPRLLSYKGLLLAAGTAPGVLAPVGHGVLVRPFGRWVAQEQSPRACPQCGYDLRATPNPVGPLLPRCPECGWEPTPVPAASGQRR